jgi:hypothetical protein
MLKHTGEDMLLVEEFLFDPSSRSTHQLLTSWDRRNQQQGLRTYIPATVDGFVLYWQLAAWVILDKHICWRLARVKSDVEERIVPVDTLCRWEY